MLHAAKSAAGLVVGLDDEAHDAQVLAHLQGSVCAGSGSCKASTMLVEQVMRRSKKARELSAHGQPWFIESPHDQTTRTFQLLLPTN